MMYARFSSTPIGPALAARDGGLTLSSTGAVGVTSVARSDIAHASGTHGVEFTFWGEGELRAVIGLVPSGASLSAGIGPQGIGWQLHTGQVVVNGSVVATGLPEIFKGDMVGVRVAFAGVPQVRFYAGEQLVHTQSISPLGALHFAVALAAAEAGGLVCAVNAGQWPHRSDAAAAGWAAPRVLPAALHLADLDYLSAATDSPAHARYEGLIVEGLETAAEIGFWPWAGEPPVRGDRATCRVLDPDGVLDEMAMQDVSGIPIAVRLGARAGTVAGADAVARYVIERIDIEDDARKRITLDDPHAALDESVTRGVYLPSIPALAWKPQPAVIGAVASALAQPANSDGTVLFLSDAPLAAVDVVLDRGDAMESGTYEVAPDGQQIVMTSPSLGPVVCDVSSIGAGPAPATLTQALTELFRRIGFAAWSKADAQAIDAATGYAGIGYYAASPAVTVRDALAAILPSYSAWWYRDDDGVLRFVRVVAPEAASGALAFDVSKKDLQADLGCAPDMAPNLTRRWAYRPNAQALGHADLVTDVVDVPPARRDELTGLWRGQVYAGGALPARYAHADTAEPFVSCFWRAEDAHAEANRVLVMYGQQRAFFIASFAGDPAFAPRPGEVGRITYPRYGLAGGKHVLVRGRRRNPATGDITLALWG
ncbi:hypothetical protein [Pseudoxanthomonas mexicana]|uniref:hypothetical protein n=1 Tax=Pseudoxanthomonas mexicana TaxID=128785 RepID=UPI00398A5BA9